MRSRLLAVVATWLLAAVCAGLAPAVASASEPHFGVSRFTFGAIANESGEARPSAPAPFTQAGGHPYEVRSLIEFNTETDSVTGKPFPVQEVRDVAVDLPPGFVGDPLATPRCALLTFIAKECKGSTQVGSFVILRQGETLLEEGEVYNLVPAHGHPAEFGFVNQAGLVFALSAGVRTGEGYGIRVEDARAPLGVQLEKVELDIWGVPADPRHDPYRGRLCNEFTYEHRLRCQGGGEPDTNPEVPYLTMPTDCSGGPLSASVSVDSWEAPDGAFPAGVQPIFQEPAMGGVTGCDLLAFEPSLEVRPESGGSSLTTSAGEPVGLHVHLDLPQTESPERVATPQVKDMTVALPLGMVVSPSSANGLVACSDAQFDLKSAAAGACPPASQLGVVKVKTPLLGAPLEGDVYLAEPRCGPCTPADAQDGRMVRLFVQVLSTDQSGVVVKLEGSGSIDPQTGQVVTSFKENPQLPFGEFELSMSGGPRATLANPRTCGPARTVADLTPWSSPFTPDAVLFSEYEVSGCLGSQFAPVFTAGTTSNQAGGLSPFTLAFGRADSDEFLSGLSMRMPPGLLGMVSKVTPCKEPQAAQGTCGPESLIGHTQVLTGPGAEPFLVTGGQVFLTEGYKGAPYGLSVLFPAKAGPYTLSGTTGTGMVVVRAAIDIDPRTAALTVTSDPLPTELNGIPLQLKIVNVTVDRPGFTFNPTSCEPMALTANLFSAEGKAKQASQRFQVTNCAALGFKPKLSLALKGKTNRGKHPALRATLTMPPGGANIAAAQVTLPHSEFLDQGHIRTVCTRVQFAAHECPKASIYGWARAITPILSEPLEGPVYLRSSSHLLPDLVAALRGPASQPVEVDLVGRIDSVNGGIRTSFESVPDAPVTKFTLTMQGGNRGLLVNSTGLCSGTFRAAANFTGQNGKPFESNPPVQAAGCPKHKKNAARKHAGTHRGGGS